MLRRFQSFLVLLLLGLMAGSGAAAGIEWTDEAGIGMACGGVGAEERAALRALEPRANLKLLLVTAGRGGYLADVDLGIYAGAASKARLELRSVGPICLFRLPAGEWRIEGRRAGVVRRTQVAVPPVVGMPPRAVIAFPAEAWDGVRASASEKREAREP